MGALVTIEERDGGGWHVAAEGSPDVVVDTLADGHVIVDVAPTGESPVKQQLDVKLGEPGS